MMGMNVCAWARQIDVKHEKSTVGLPIVGFLDRYYPEPEQEPGRDALFFGKGGGPTDTLTTRVFHYRCVKFKS